MSQLTEDKLASEASGSNDETSVSPSAQEKGRDHSRSAGINGFEAADYLILTITIIAVLSFILISVALFN